MVVHMLNLFSLKSFKVTKEITRKYINILRQFIILQIICFYILVR